MREERHILGLPHFPLLCSTSLRISGTIVIVSNKKSKDNLNMSHNPMVIKDWKKYQEEDKVKENE